MSLRSPIHPETMLQAMEIEPGLSAYTCPKSGGVWIPQQSFLSWKENQKPQKPQLASGGEPAFADDSKRGALTCPESGRLLIRYKVGHGLPFHVDLSPATGGVWLDKGEWEALKRKGLHVELNLIFTPSYQRQIRNAEYEETLDQTFRDRIGEEDFQKVTGFKRWLAEHPKQRDICCYLLHNIADPERGEPPAP